MTRHSTHIAYNPFEDEIQRQSKVHNKAIEEKHFFLNHQPFAIVSRVHASIFSKKMILKCSFL